MSQQNESQRFAALDHFRIPRAVFLPAFRAHRRGSYEEDRFRSRAVYAENGCGGGSRRGLSHEVAAACSRGRQPAVRVESTGKSHEVATASVVVACYRHFVANQWWASDTVG